MKKRDAYNQDRAAFDKDLPKEIPVSSLSRDTGRLPIDEAFGRMTGRDKWAIAWMEADNRQGLAGLQLIAGWMRRDAVDARAYGCTGLMGLHWRTDIIAPNVSALAQAGWDQSWNTTVEGDGKDTSDKPRGLPVDDFYADFAKANFGLPEAGKIFAKLDGNTPGTGDGKCPSGNLTPVKTPWPTIAQRFAFVQEFEQLRPKVTGAGNLARFDYWLHNFKYLRTINQLRCASGTQNTQEIRRLYPQAYGHLLATVNSPGALGMIVNMELNTGWGPAATKAAGIAWPKEYQGDPRLIVPCVRSSVSEGEPLKLRIIALSREPVESVTVHVRSMGEGAWKTVTAKHVARAVWKAELPAAQNDFEYYITSREDLVWPATAPEMSQTVVITN